MKPARVAGSEQAKRKRQGGCTDTTKMAVTILKNAISGIITIWLYFMDLISDYQVTCPLSADFAGEAGEPGSAAS